MNGQGIKVHLRIEEEEVNITPNRVVMERKGRVLRIVIRRRDGRFEWRHSRRNREGIIRRIGDEILRRESRWIIRGDK